MRTSTAPERQVQGVWLMLVILGAMLSVVGWYRWMT
jgi:hypothetical protein